MSDVSLNLLLAGSPGCARPMQQVREEVTGFYLRHRDAVFRFLVLNSRNPTEAEDLTHEVFLRLWVRYAAGDSIECPLAWLLTAARNLLIDRGRHLRLEAPLSESVWSRFSRTCRDSSPDTERVLLREARHAEIERALDQLQGLERDCLWLRLKDVTFREIAEALDIPMSAAVSHTNRALAKIRRRVKP
jgi:RNA polymerase sigma-70 factor (ECF subfamily)